jgi:hypothetical protein
MEKEFAILIALCLSACNFSSPRSEPLNSGSSNPQPLPSGKTEVSQSSPQNCTNLKRSLNPAPKPIASEQDLDRYFRLAYSNETEGNFDKAILNYRKAAELSQCDCDRKHAEAGEKAAKEAKKLFEANGMSAKPTQFFWGRLQGLTQSLSCVKIQY